MVIGCEGNLCAFPWNETNTASNARTCLTLLPREDRLASLLGIGKSICSVCQLLGRVAMIPCPTESIRIGTDPRFSKNPTIRRWFTATLGLGGALICARCSTPRKLWATGRGLHRLPAQRRASGLSYTVSLCDSSCDRNPSACIACPPSGSSTCACSITRTGDELPVVAPEHADPGPGDRQPGWCCLELERILDLSTIGVLAGISKLLADAKVSIFAISTYNTDHMRVRAGEHCDSYFSGGASAVRSWVRRWA